MPYTQAMTVNDIITELQAVRFTGTSPTATQLQRWINDRYAALWNADEWIFKYGKTSVTVTSGSPDVSNLPTDFGIPIGLWRADGYPLLHRPPRDFYNVYAGATDTGSPQFYTAIDQALTVGPVSNETSTTYTLVYEKRLTALVGSTDTPAIPAEHHYLLVTGVLSLGSRIFNDFTWEFHEQAWQQGIQEMRREWLIDQRGEAGVWGRDQIEALPTAWGV